MSRIIVKNLPKQITAKKLQELFSQKGFVTDLQLKYNKSGEFRQFAFIGYKTEEEAQAAKEYFDNTFVQTSKIKVEFCYNLSDPNAPKPWKKFLQEKSSNKIKDPATSEKDIEKQASIKKNSKTKEEFPEELIKDAKFQEFLNVNQDNSKPIWGDETLQLKDNEIEADDDNLDKNDSDLKLEEHKEKNSSKLHKVIDDQFTIKLKNLPFKVKKKQIKHFFHPLKPISLRLPPKSKGFAYAKFKTEKEMSQALNKNKSFLGDKQIFISKYEKKQNIEKIEEKKEESNDVNNEELLAETGRIFIRNLCFSVKEEELTELFSKYGPLVEVHIPINHFTKESQGFAFVTFIFPEHAVKAFSELDGTIFQGRMLHLIPGQSKKEYIIQDEEETNFKKKKQAKLKSTSGSSHNWNIVFLGANAVADVIAEKYNVEKSKLLDGSSTENISVRMALSETQLVLETRKFLIENGVELDSFSQAAAERSKTVILAKNLPRKTSSEELYEKFSKYGTISKIILPPSKLAALIIFQEPTEAKNAFTNLAYTRIHHLPLYLEWAPMNAVKLDKLKNGDIISNPQDSTCEKPEKSKETKDEEKESEEPEEEPEAGTTLFVKNINFDTPQEKFKKHFHSCGPIHYATISTKKDKEGRILSMGFGFVQFKKKSSAVKAIQNLQGSMLDGHALELKFVNRATTPHSHVERKKSVETKQNSSKILVRNIPFQADKKDIEDLFKEFGNLRVVRLPMKLGGHEHRGFGFVEYTTRSSAKIAFEALCHSTHLYGRRLVLEWANQESESVENLRRKTAKQFSSSGQRSKKLKLAQQMDNEDERLEAF